MKTDSDPHCQKCHFREETGHHVLCSCNVLENLTVKDWGSHFCKPDDFKDIPYAVVNAYMVETALVKKGYIQEYITIGCI